MKTRETCFPTIEKGSRSSLGFLILDLHILKAETLTKGMDCYVTYSENYAPGKLSNGAKRQEGLQKSHGDQQKYSTRSTTK